MTDKVKPPVVLLMGPTATGKTELAMELHRALACDIVSVDSALVYKGMNIGTAKPGPEQLADADGLAGSAGPQILFGQHPLERLPIHQARPARMGDRSGHEVPRRLGHGLPLRSRGTRQGQKHHGIPFAGVGRCGEEEQDRDADGPHRATSRGSRKSIPGRSDK